MKVICVTGTPGTGKTTLSKKLAAKLNLHYIGANKLISKNKISEGYDRKRKTKIVDVKKLNKHILIEIKSIRKSQGSLNKRLIIKNFNKKPENKKIKGIIIDSHLSHHLPRKYVNICIVTKCGIKELSKRLGRKRFSKSKILENLQAEIFNICHNEALANKHKVIVQDTTKAFNIERLAKRVGG